MKKYKSVFLIAAVFLFSISAAHAQTLNWGSLKKEQKHVASIYAGFDYGVTYGIGYSYHLKSKLPMLLNIDFSVPAGENGFDDLKTKIGAKAEVFSYKNIKLIASAHGIYRRYQNPSVRLQNFGSEFTAVAGYYKKRWFAGAEVGFDKAIVTHFKHSSIFKSDYPAVKDGWYEPATGGNFSYGVQGGYSFKRSDITLKAGKILAEDFKTKPTLPFYLQLGYNIRFK